MLGKVVGAIVIAVRDVGCKREDYRQRIFLSRRLVNGAVQVHAVAHLDLKSPDEVDGDRRPSRGGSFGRLRCLRLARHRRLGLCLGQLCTARDRLRYHKAKQGCSCERPNEAAFHNRSFQSEFGFDFGRVRLPEDWWSTDTITVGRLSARAGLVMAGRQEDSSGPRQDEFASAPGVARVGIVSERSYSHGTRSM
jgi:hypothetical protein